MKPIWTHITIQVTDLDRSTAFYEKWCGLTVVQDRRNSRGSTVWIGSEADSDQKQA